jgi:hypothetical protein
VPKKKNAFWHIYFQIVWNHCSELLSIFKDHNSQRYDHNSQSQWIWAKEGHLLSGVSQLSENCLKCSPLCFISWGCCYLFSHPKVWWLPAAGLRTASFKECFRFLSLSLVDMTMGSFSTQSQAPHHFWGAVTVPLWLFRNHMTFRFFYHTV